MYKNMLQQLSISQRIISLIFIIQCIAAPNIGSKAEPILATVIYLNIFPVRNIKNALCGKHIPALNRIIVAQISSIFIKVIQQFNSCQTVMVEMNNGSDVQEDKGIIRICKSKKGKQHNGQKKKFKRTNNDLQNMHIKLKIE